uniref:Flea very short abundant peptide family n=1 Tax=Ctenocephalides felis TaxID=7515 RepID=I3VPF2_CTEFE
MNLKFLFSFVAFAIMAFSLGEVSGAKGKAKPKTGGGGGADIPDLDRR